MLLGRSRGRAADLHGRGRSSPPAPDELLLKMWGLTVLVVWGGQWGNGI